MEGILFFDIETVPQFPPKERLTAIPKSFIDRFTRQETLSFGELIQKYSEQAALFAEWGKVVSVSIGSLHKGHFYVKTLASRFEKDILNAVAQSLNQSAERGNSTMGGHNIKTFDLPYLYRRMKINGITVPKMLDIAGKKPWDVPHLDTMELWACGDLKHKMSLSTLAECLGIASPKGDMSGADVDNVFYGWANEVQTGELPLDSEEIAMQRIANYNAGDVVCSARVYAKLKGFPAISDNNITYLPLTIGKE